MKKEIKFSMKTTIEEKKKSQKYKSYNRSKQFEPNEFYKRVNGQEHIIKLKGKCTLSSSSLTHLQVIYLFKK